MVVYLAYTFRSIGSIHPLVLHALREVYNSKVSNIQTIVVSMWPGVGWHVDAGSVGPDTPEQGVYMPYHRGLGSSDTGM